MLQNYSFFKNGLIKIVCLSSNTGRFPFNAALCSETVDNQGWFYNYDVYRSKPVRMIHLTS